MYMIMKAEVFKDGEWKKVGSVFKSALDDSLLTDRVCDAIDPVLYEILGHYGALKIKHTSIKTIPSTVVDNTNIIYLSDILQYNWDATMSCIGTISEFQYKMLKEKGMLPANKNRHIFDDNAKVVEPFEMDMILKDESLRGDYKYYVHYEYDTQHLQALCGFFCDVSIPTLMKQIPKGGSANDVRVKYVFVIN